jgi:flagellar biosynthesis protein FlhG
MLPDRPTEVIGIASGKGGVGKTTVSVNLAVALAHQGHKVMLFDADLGLANAQLALGCRPPLNFSHVLDGTHSLNDVIVTTSQGIMLVPGASGMQRMASLSRTEIGHIIGLFSDLKQDIDYLIVDVAAGISESVMLLMAATQRRFIVIRDEPSSIADAYGAIKVLTRDHGLEEIYLLPNAIASQQAGRLLHQRLNEVCGKFLGRSLRYLHSIEADPQIGNAQRNHRSILEHAPSSPSARDFRLLAQALKQETPILNASGTLQFFTERMFAPRT